MSIPCVVWWDLHCKQFRNFCIVLEWESSLIKVKSRSEPDDPNSQLPPKFWYLSWIFYKAASFTACIVNQVCSYLRMPREKGRKEGEKEKERRKQGGREGRKKKRKNINMLPNMLLSEISYSCGLPILPYPAMLITEE